MVALRKVLASHTPSLRVPRVPPILVLAAAALLLGGILLFQAHSGRMTVSTSCFTPNPTADDPDPAPACREHGVGWWPWVGALAVALLLAAATLLVLYVRPRRTRAAWVAALSLAVLGLAAVLFVAWLGAQGGSALCVPDTWAAQAEEHSDPPACDVATTPPPWWAVYAQGGWLATGILGLTGCAAAPALARRDPPPARARRRRG
jgi:hypothetical protein